jgi:hypothetical protein
MELQLHHATNSRLQSKTLELHDEALAIAKRYRQCEAEFLNVIMRVESRKIYLEFEVTSLHEYCVEMLGLSLHVANDFINVARTSFEVPELAEAIYSNKTSVSKARKICSVLTNKNSKEWIDLVVHCSCRVVEKAVASANPRSAIKESLKYVSSDVLELRLAVSEEWSELLTKTKDRLSQSKRRAVSTEEALFILMKEAHEQHDPVRKAERSKARKAKKQTSSSRAGAISKLEEKPNSGSREQDIRPERSRSLPAAVHHEVTLRDQGRCIHVPSSGRRCKNKRWIDQHHVLPFAHGGKHTADNLQTLCSAHHKIRHKH